MRKVFIAFSLMTFSLVASEIGFSLKLLQGNDSYTVTKPSSDLKAKLVFPKELYLADLRFLKQFNELYIQVCAATSLFHKNKSGEDFDWQNNTLTFYSTSDDKVERYLAVEIKIGYLITKDIAVSLFAGGEEEDHVWRDLVQKDVIADTIITADGEVLKYEQILYKIGIESSYQISNNIFFAKVVPRIGYVYHDAIDHHLLRYFYTTQHNEGIELAIEGEVGYKLTTEVELFLRYEFLWFEDLQSDMKYYFESTNDMYQTLPSSFESYSHIVTLGLGYTF